jgi:hypothetical protein
VCAADTAETFRNDGRKRTGLQDSFSSFQLPRSSICECGEPNFVSRLSVYDDEAASGRPRGRAEQTTASKQAELMTLTKLRVALALQDQNSRFTIDVSEVLGGRSFAYSSTTVLTVSNSDTVRNIKLALIQQLQLQCLPEDLELYDDGSCRLEPLKNCCLLSSTLSRACALKSPRPYAGVLIASYS